MDCLLFRHGIAYDREDWRGNDQTRPLTDKGRIRTRQASKGLLALGPLPTHILSSPLTRAQETAKIVRALMPTAPPLRICHELNPEVPPRALIALLNTLPSDAVVLCVGHEPHLSATAAILLTGKLCKGLSLKKAGACLLHLEGSVRPAKSRLDWWLTAAQLRALA
ncbi:MAG: histidine phosphatase family protein [Nitrospira sp.]|nr:histidine phosphatase family protein [Nitrospira sp.]